MKPTVGALLRGCIPTIAVAGMLLAAAPASLAAEAQGSDVAGVCRVVLGTQPGTSQDGACIDSLSHSARSLSEARTNDDARRACAASGATANDPAFDRCVVRKRHDMSDTRSIVRVRTPPTERAASPYSHASPREVRYRERLACASLGLDPDTRGFSACVTDLDAALFAADHPMN